MARTLAPSPSSVFFWAALAAGLVLIGLTPPFQVPDEPNHFYRAYQIADGALVSQRLSTSVGGVLPRSLPMVASAVIGEVPFRPDVKPDRRAWAAAFKTPLAPDDRMEVIFPNTALSGPVAYLPQALGMALGKTLGVPALAVFYFGRAMTLLLCVALTAIALRVMPVRPWTCVMLSLVPMTLFVRSSVSSDAPTLALALMAVASCCQLASRSEQSTSAADAWPLYLIAALLAFGKPPYALVTLLALAIPASVFRSRRARAATLLTLIVVVTTLQAAWLLALRRRTEAWAPGSDPPAQLALIADAPVDTAGLLVRDLAGSAPVLYHQMIGVLGWLDAPLATPVVVLIGIAIVLVALSEAPLTPVRMRWASLALGAAGILGLQAMNYVYWTPPGAVHVGGLQGRHLAPFAPLLLLSLPAPSAIAQPLALVRRHIIVVFIVVAVGATLLTVLRRYYLDI